MFRALGRVLRSTASEKMMRVRSTVSEKMMRVQKAITGLELKGCSPEPYPDPPVDSSLFDSRSILLGDGIHAFRTYYVGEVVGDVENQLYDLKKKLLMLGTCKPDVSTSEVIMNDARLDLKGFTLLDKHAVLECIKNYVFVLRKVDTRDCYFQYLIHLVMGDYIKLSTSPEVLLLILRVQNVFQDLDITVVECAVEDYVHLCEEYCPSSSEDSKNHLVTVLENDRANEMASVYVDGLDRFLFKIPARV